MTVRIEKTSDGITASLNRIARALPDVPQGAYQEWVKNTPVRSGNARRRTRLVQDTIRANYQYAVPLDQGSSRQAPEGMARPTLRWLRNRLRQIIRK